MTVVRVVAAALVVVSGLALVSLCVGPGDVSVAAALRVVAAHVGLGPASEPALVDALVWDLRLPRALLTVAVGTALSVAGMITQGLFRNPMAEPGVLGVSAGAAAAVVVGFALGLDKLGLWVTPTLAALGAAGVLMVLFGIARPVGGMTTLLLSGIALGALCSAITTLVLATSTERWDLGAKVVLWLMGSFEARTWGHLGAAAAALVVGLGLAAWLRVDLDALQLGTDTAASLGTDLGRTRLLALGAVAVLAGTATAVSGVIVFLGLVAPHVARLWVGAGHRALLPASAALGGVVLLAVDTGSRLSPTVALPPGAIMSLIGAPFFLWLLRRHNRRLDA